jgi:SagB-type dehydrogenase family enzyme
MKKSKNYCLFLNEAKSLSQKFFETIKIKRFSSNKFDSKILLNYLKNDRYKSYSRLEEIKLYKPKFHKTIFFEKSKASLSLEYLSYVLYFSAGIKRKITSGHIRFYPSIGFCYPLEVYVLSLNTDLKRGLYHYYLRNNSLERLLIIKKIELKKYFSLPTNFNIFFIVLITAIFERSTEIYGDRGYNYTLLEAGHLGQNFYLNALNIGLECWPIGEFADYKLNDLLDIDGINEAVIYSLAIGNVVK